MPFMGIYTETTHRLINATSKDEVAAPIQEACGEFDLDNYLFSGLISITPTSLSPVLLNGYPQEWRERYDSRNYIAIDPVVTHCFNNTTPLLWQNIPASILENKKIATFMAESRDFGLTTGATVPMHGPLGEISALSFTSREDASRSLPRIMKAMQLFQLLVPYLHEAVSRVGRSDDVKPLLYELSDREKECLLWAADGKTSWETAMILKVSERTVNFHLQNAAKKLKCGNRTHVVARAISLRLINPWFR